MGFEEVLRRVGSDGIFQRCFAIFGAFACVVPLMQNLATIFSLESHPFECVYDGNETIADSCFRDKNGVKQQCPHFNFNPAKDGYSLRNHFLLVCEREYLGEFTNMFFFIGLAVAGATGGLFADKFGRKPLGACSTSLMAIGGFCAPLMTNLWLYTACRVVIGLGIPGLYNGIFTVFLENLDTRRRSHYYILVIQGWSSGVLFTALFGYLFPDFRYYEFAMAVATVPIVLATIFLPESPRWYYATGKYEEAVAALNRIAKYNRERPITMQEFHILIDCEDEDPEIAKKVFKRRQSMFVDALNKGGSRKIEPAALQKTPPQQTPSLKEILEYKYIIIVTLITWFNWFSVSMCYYGWSLMVGELGNDNKFLNLILSGSVEIGGRFVIVFLSDKVGRVPFSVCLLWTVSAFGVGAAILTELGHRDTVPLMVMGMLGRSAISWSWDILGLISAEYAPTPIRTLISGTVSTWCRIGSIISSQFTTLQRYNANGPHYLICGITFIAGLSCFIYPETRGHELSDTMEEADLFIKENLGVCRKREEPTVAMKNLKDEQS